MLDPIRSATAASFEWAYGGREGTVVVPQRLCVELCVRVPAPYERTILYSNSLKKGEMGTARVLAT